ncbi:hypothetical protein BK720_13865 [Bacillus thuringiensis serovar brasilensis]|nr:hypothetical protein BK720_13865 [Bacillus thuringiensis serovar brasilensis]
MPYIARVEKVENNPEKRSKKIHSLTYLYGKTLYFLKKLHYQLLYINITMISMFAFIFQSIPILNNHFYY